MVLSVTMLITVIGIGALATSRVTSRGAGISADWQEAGAVAFSAVEHAVSKLNAEGAAAPAAWRAPYASGAVAFEKRFNRGRLKWVLVDEDDGAIADDYVEPFKIYGIGHVGSTRRVYSATLVPGGEAMAVLRTACHAAEEVKITDTTVAFNGPVSTNGNLVFSGAGMLRGSSEVAGSGGTSSPVKPMPSASMFELYAARATAIPASAFSGGVFAPTGGLSAENNPYGDENPEGIYVLTIPDSMSSLEIQSCRIKGTLLVTGAETRTDQTVRLTGAMLLEPHRANLPTLITKRLNAVTVSGAVAQFTESGTTYPSEIRGLVHCIGTSQVTLQNATYLFGTLVCDGKLELTGTVGITVDTRLYANPPLGYTKGDRVTVAPGSWKWDAPPTGS
jgi:hypothetical protein